MHPPPPLCDFCQEVVNLARHSREDPGAFSLEKHSCFNASAAACSLCALLCDSLRTRYGPEPVAAYDDEARLPHRAEVAFDYSRVLGEDENVSEVVIRLENRLVEEQWAVILSLWADPDTPAAAKFISRPPIAANDSPQAANLIGTLVYDCVTNHYHCGRRDAEGQLLEDHEAELPTRILEIEGDGYDFLKVRLIETKGRRGNYCALSHCWGPPERRPPRTLKGNLAQRLDGIPLDELPRTFREAVMLTCRLGVSYLWIDSLCIVQDDAEDWAREAAVMGSIYRRALLVIAAAGAGECSEGLLVTDRSHLRTLQVPLGTEDEPGQGHLSIATTPPGITFPNQSLLWERGWVYQEWNLGRRIAFCLPGGLIFGCFEFNLNENGVHIPYELYERQHWYYLLQTYTTKKLTFAADRLPALQGIAAERRPTDNPNPGLSFRFGVFTNDALHHQLLWKTVAPPIIPGQEDLPSLPSWSWAATGAEKDWIVRLYDGADTRLMEQMPKALQVADDGLLVVTSGATMALRLQQSEISHDEAWDIDTAWVGFPERATWERDGIKAKSSSYPCHLVRDAFSGRILGLAVFDDGQFVAEVVCLLLATMPRRRRAILYP